MAAGIHNYCIYAKSHLEYFIPTTAIFHKRANTKCRNYILMVPQTIPDEMVKSLKDIVL